VDATAVRDAFFDGKKGKRRRGNAAKRSSCSNSAPFPLHLDATGRFPRRRSWLSFDYYSYHPCCCYRCQIFICNSSYLVSWSPCRSFFYPDNFHRL
jgi:hypothetical protein